MESPLSTTSYRESHVDSGGQGYDDVFRDRRDLAVMWEVERRLLDQIVARRFAGRPFRYLDFACGTGRILAHVEQSAAEAVGVDISPTQLEVARRQVRRARLLQGDLTRQDLLGDQRFDLITSFRFFPNAEPALRRDVLSALVAHLAPGGAIVFNNHQNADGLRRRLVALAGRNPGHQMTGDEVDALLAGAGLRCVRRWGVGLVPFSHRMMPLPGGLLSRLEHRLSDSGPSTRWATSLLFECERAPAGSAGPV